MKECYGLSKPEISGYQLCVQLKKDAVVGHNQRAIPNVPCLWPPEAIKSHKPQQPFRFKEPQIPLFIT